MTMIMMRTESIATLICAGLFCASQTATAAVSDEKTAQPEAVAVQKPSTTEVHSSTSQLARSRISVDVSAVDRYVGGPVKVEVQRWILEEHGDRNPWPLSTESVSWTLVLSESELDKTWSLVQSEGPQKSRLASWTCQACSWTEMIAGGIRLLERQLEATEIRQRQQAEQARVAALAAAQRDEGAPRWVRYASLGTLIAGGTMMVVGGGLWAAQTGSTSDAELQRRDFRLPGALTFGIGGALAIGGGVWTWKAFRADDFSFRARERGPKTASR